MSLSRNLPADIFHIATGSSDPIYRQMIEQVRRLVIGGQISAGDNMPSVREVAGTLGVNPMTVSKAYSMLESEGLLERRRGMGMIVSSMHSSHRGGQQNEAKLELLKPSLQKLVQEVRQLQLDPEPVIELFSHLLKKKD